MRRALAVGLLLAFPPSLAAQELSLLVGGSHARYADSLNGTAGMAGVRLALGHGARALQFDGVFSGLTEGGWVVQGSGQATALWSVSRPILLGLAAGASVNDVEDGLVTGTAAGGPMLALRAGRVQIVAGTTGGAFRAIDGAWSPLGNASLRAYAVLRPWIALDVGGSGTVTDSLGLIDVSARAQLARGPLRVSVLGGARAGDLEDGPWGSADLSLDLGRRVVLEASVGRYPRDLTGFTDGVYAQFGVRLYAHRLPAPLRLSQAVDVRRLDAARARVVLRYGTEVPRLAIAGDWNGWIPVPLRSLGNGRWVVELELPPGAYGYALRADGDWALPDGVTGVDDGFGGVVARLIVPR